MRYYAAILLWLNLEMALLSFCYLPFALYVIHKIQPKLSTLAKTVAESNADITHFLFEALSGTSLIRAFGAEKLERRKLESKQSHMLKYLLHYQILGAFSGPCPMVFIIINTLIVFGMEV
jgi:ABC-type multidrug transport system fused ATPase/permease subunit